MADELAFDPVALQRLIESTRGLLGAFEPTDADKRMARSNGLMAAGLGVLGAGPGTWMQAVGRGGLLGLNTYDTSLKDVQAQRMQNLQQAMALMPFIKQSQWAGELSPPPGGAAPWQSQNTAAVAAGKVGGLPTLENAAALPVQTPVDAKPRNIWEELSNMGAQPGEIKALQAAKDPQAALDKLYERYGKIHTGAGNVPYRSGPGGSLYAVPVKDYNTILSDQTAAVEGTKKKIETANTMFGYDIGGGEKINIPLASALKLQNSGLPPQVRNDIAKGVSPDKYDEAIAAYRDVASGKNPGAAYIGGGGQPSATPSVGSGGGVEPSPLAVELAKQQALTTELAKRGATSAGQDVSKTIFDDQRKRLDAARGLVNHIGTMEDLDSRGLFSGPVQKWGGSFSNVWNSAFPDYKINATRLANSQQFASEVSRMQQALGKAFPGQQSNYELQTVTASLPTLLLSPEGRSQIYQAVRNAYAYEQSMYDSASSHWMKNNGSLVGWSPSAYEGPKGKSQSSGKVVNFADLPKGK